MNGGYLEGYHDPSVLSDQGSPEEAWNWPNPRPDLAVTNPCGPQVLPADANSHSPTQGLLSAEDIVLINDSLYRHGLALEASMQKLGEPMAPLNSQLCALSLEKQAKLLLLQQLDYHHPGGATAIVLAPGTFTHAFARPWVSSTARRGVVERPQRLVACGVGVGAALARHYSHHSTPRSLSKSKSSSSLLKTLTSTPDVMVKACMRRVDLRDCPHIAKVHGSQWAHNVYALCKTANDKLARGTLEVPAAWPSGDMYLCAGTASALENVVGALEDAVDLLFGENQHSRETNDKQTRKAQIDRTFVVVRPPGHHARRGAPSGFCVMNNVHVGVQYAAQKYGITHAAIIDFDLHHGDGTQALCFELAGKEEEQDYTQRVKMGYFSVHDIQSFPAEDQGLDAIAAASLKQLDTTDYGNPSESEPCVWNVHLDSWESRGGTAGEAAFWDAYETKYRQIVDRAGEFLRHEYIKHQRGINNTSSNNRKGIPPARFMPLIVVSAGFDASEYEAAGMRRHGACVPTRFFEQITADIVALAARLGHEFGMGPQVKIMSVLEGGYADKALATGVFAHLTGLLGGGYSSLSGDASDDIGNPFVAHELERACRGRWSVGSVRGALAGTRKTSEEAAAWAACASQEERDRVAHWLEPGLVAGREIWADDADYREWRIHQGRSDGARDIPVASERVLRSNHNRREKQRQEILS